MLLRLSPPADERLLESSALHTFFGGAEANVAVALSHLGVRADYVTRLPENPLGHAALEVLQREGVGTEWILRGGARMGLYFVEPGTDARAMRVVYDRAGSAFAGIDPKRSTGLACSPARVGSTPPGLPPPSAMGRYRHWRQPSVARARAACRSASTSITAKPCGGV